MVTEMNSEKWGRVRVVKVPEGEAPYFVREAWLNLELPCYPFIGKVEGERDVVSRKLVPSHYGVQVPQDLAIARLRCHCPSAVEWWQAQGYPLPDHLFVFPLTDVEILEGVTPQSPTYVTEEMMGDPGR